MKTNNKKKKSHDMHRMMDKNKSLEKKNIEIIRNKIRNKTMNWTRNELSSLLFFLKIQINKNKLTNNK